LPPIATDTEDGADLAEAAEVEDGDEYDEGGSGPGLVWEEYPTAVWVCTDPEGNGHRDRWTTPTGGYGEPRKTITQWTRLRPRPPAPSGAT